MGGIGGRYQDGGRVPAPNTIPAKTVGAIRMIVSRTLELNPVLLGSNKYASRANILRVQEAVDIQAARGVDSAPIG